MENLFSSIVAKQAGISSEHPLARVLTGRGNIIELTQRTYDAALRPEPTGGLTHAERAALACRIAQLNNDNSLAAHFEDMIQFSENIKLISDITDTGFKGGDDPRIRAIIRHTDLVTALPREATDADICALRSVGVADEDIVRLSELIAFVSYLVRVLAGLRLMAAVA